MHVHVHVESPALREFHLIIAKDLVDDCLFPVHNLVVRQRKQMSLIIEVEHRECQPLGKRHPLPGLLHKVVQRVIHPAKIPLVVETEPSLIHRLRTAREGCGVLGDQHRCGMQLMQSEIHPL